MKRELFISFWVVLLIIVLVFSIITVYNAFKLIKNFLQPFIKSTLFQVIFKIKLIDCRLRLLILNFGWLFGFNDSINLAICIESTIRLRIKTLRNLFSYLSLIIGNWLFLQIEIKKLNSPLVPVLIILQNELIESGRYVKNWSPQKKKRKFKLWICHR